MIYLLSTLLLLLGVLPSAHASTRLGLHVTQEELNCWRQRAGIDAQGANGITCPVKYKTAGDVQANSPGDWDHIVQQKNAFMANLASTSPPYFWIGPPDIGRCFLHTDPYYAGSGPSGGIWEPLLGDPLMDAAFYSLVANDATVRTAVRNNLIATAARPTLNFSNGTLWCPSTANDIGMHWGYSLWMSKLIHGYDYVRSALSAGDRTTLDAWVLGFGVFTGAWTTIQAATVWVAPDSDNYTLTSGGSWQCSDNPRVAYFGGPVIYAGTGTLINRKATAHTIVGIVGVMLNHADLKNRATHRFKEYIKYGVFPQGAAMDFERWQDGPATQGWRYSAGSLQSYVEIADAFGRAGDTSLLTYQTSEGMCSGLGSTAGGPKSLGLWITQYLAYVQSPGQYTRYGTDTSGNQDAAHLIKSVDGIDGQASIRDTNVMMTNLFYQDATVKSIYLRQAANTPAYPASPEGGGYYVWGGTAGVYPGILFMFGQLEGVVDPYNLSVGGPTPPVLLRLLR